MFKKIRKKLVLGLLVFGIFIGGMSYVSAQTFKSDTGIITSLFELAPKLEAYAHPFNGGFFPDSDSIFRLLGTSFFNNITSSENSHFDNLLLGSTYTSDTIPTSELQVAGSIQVEQLLDPNALGDTAYLCVNDFGVLSRCPGVASFVAACHTPVYGANGTQSATDTATGCDGGEFFDTIDTASGITGDWQWGCRGISDSIAANPSDPTDVLCSHPNNGELGGGPGE